VTEEEVERLKQLFFACGFSTKKDLNMSYQLGDSTMTIDGNIKLIKIYEMVVEHSQLIKKGIIPSINQNIIKPIKIVDIVILLIVLGTKNKQILLCS
jgi:hypothetical protein